jgi:hypothetical protein
MPAVERDLIPPASANGSAEVRTQEAGAIVWNDATGAWFLKNTLLKRGKENEVNHRLGYVRETDYVSAAFAMVSRALFLK